MADEAQATAPEAPAAPVQDATPQNAGQPETDKAEQQDQEQKPPTDKVSRQQRVHLKQQAALRREREAFEQERQQLNAQLEQERAEIAQFKTWKEETAKGNPWAFLKANNLDLNELYKLALKEEQDPRVVAQAAAQELEKKFEERLAQIERERQEEQQAAAQAREQAQRAHVLSEIDQFLAANAERFELTRAYQDAGNLVLEVIWQTYQQSGGKNVPTYEEAVAQVESYIEEQEVRNNPLFKTGKAKKWLLDDSGNVVNQTKTSAARDARRKQAPRDNQSKEPRTLQNRMASVSTSAPGKETYEERKERLLREWNNGTFKPRAQHN